MSSSTESDELNKSVAEGTAEQENGSPMSEAELNIGMSLLEMMGSQRQRGRTEYRVLTLNNALGEPFGTQNRAPVRCNSEGSFGQGANPAANQQIRSANGTQQGTRAAPPPLQLETGDEELPLWRTPPPNRGVTRFPSGGNVMPTVTPEVSPTQPAHENDTQRRTSVPQPQPEEEADESIHEAKEQEVKGSGSDDLHRSRRSMPDDPEPAREPQPKDSPRESGSLTSTVKSAMHTMGEPDDEPPEAFQELLEASVMRSDTSPIPRAIPACWSPGDLAVPACEDGMDRHKTLLHQIEQSELVQQLSITVPEGIDENMRFAQFEFGGQTYHVEVPEESNPGDVMPVQIKTLPPLEMNERAAYVRGHTCWQDRNSIMEQFRITSSPSAKRELYSMLRGRNIRPLLPYTPEEQD